MKPEKNAERVIRNKFPKVKEITQTKEAADGTQKAYTYYKVDARSEKWGMKDRFTFSTQKEAIDKANEIADQIARFGAVPVMPEDTQRHADNYRKLLLRLEPFGKLPEDAVAHYVEWLGKEAVRDAKPTVAELMDQYKAHKLLEHEGEGYENEINVHCKYMKATWGAQKIDTLRKNEIDARLTKDKPHKGTRKKYLTHLKMFFRWVIGEDKGYIASSPIETLTYQADKFAKEHFNTEQAKSLLNIVQEVAPELIGYYAALTFVGVRPSEGARIVWADVNFETKQLRVNDDSKTGQRYCLLEPVALAWLQYHYEKCNFGQKPFIPVKSLIRPKMDYNLFNVEKDVRDAFKAKHNGLWPSDVLRHTFASHYVTLIEDEPKVAYYMGNSVATIKKHYAKRLPKSELEAFWGLTPKVAFKK